jgi:hypothetical protein
MYFPGSFFLNPNHQIIRHDPPINPAVYPPINPAVYPVVYVPVYPHVFPPILNPMAYPQQIYPPPIFHPMEAHAAQVAHRHKQEKEFTEIEKTIDKEEKNLQRIDEKVAEHERNVKETADKLLAQLDLQEEKVRSSVKKCGEELKNIVESTTELVKKAPTFSDFYYS